MILYDNSKLPDAVESSLNEILKKVFVMPSVDMGILGNPDKFNNVAGDGTCMPSKTSLYVAKRSVVASLKEAYSAVVNVSFLTLLLPGVGIVIMNIFSTVTVSMPLLLLIVFIVCPSLLRLLPANATILPVFMLLKSLWIYTLSCLFILLLLILLMMLLISICYCSSYGISPVIDLNPHSSKPASNNELVIFDDKGIPYGKACGHKLRT